MQYTSRPEIYLSSCTKTVKGAPPPRTQRETPSARNRVRIPKGESRPKEVEASRWPFRATQRAKATTGHLTKQKNIIVKEMIIADLSVKYSIKEPVKRWD